MTLNVLNPRAKASKKGRKKAKSKAKGPRKPAAKQIMAKARKRKARKHTTAAATPAKRKKHRSRRKSSALVHNPPPRPNRKKSKARTLLAKVGKMGLPAGKDIAGMIAGVVAVSAATKAMAAGAPLFDNGPSSLAGESWNAKQYAVAGALMLFGPALVDRVFKGGGSAFRIGVGTLIVAKTVMPLVSRIPVVGEYLGEAESEGDVRVTDDGQSWIWQGGQWNALQGLVDSTALDGLVDSTALDAADDDQVIVLRGNDGASIDLNDQWAM